MESEIWKPIIGFSNYEVSNCGHIRSLNYSHTGNIKILKTPNDGSGYAQVLLWIDGKKYKRNVHRLVAEAFIPNPKGKPCVDHINTNRMDNRAENLRWCTQKENCNNELSINNYRQSRIGKRHSIKTKRHISNVKSIRVYQFSKEGVYIKSYKGAKEAQDKTSIDKSSISRCCRGIQITAGDFMWSYKREKIIVYSPKLPMPSALCSSKGGNTIPKILVCKERKC